MAKDISKAGGKIWHLKSPVIDIWFVREAAVSCLDGGNLSTANAQENWMLYFPLADMDGSVVSFPTSVS